MKAARILFFRLSWLQCRHKCRPICLSSSVRAGERLSLVDGAQVKSCYKVIGVSDESSNEEVREAYVRLAKQYHPDSQTQFANANRFVDIEEAYRRIMSHRKEAVKAPPQPDLDEETFDIKHTAPQHRQYLTFEGVGYGTPSQRQHQYQQRKVMRALDTVFEYRTQQISALHENAMVTKDKKETRKRTIRNAIDRLVEDLIAESMAKGDFDNLPGAGKPLPHVNHNPYIDTTTHNLNRILINNGYVPQWVTLEKEIRQTISQARDDLLKALSLRSEGGREHLSSARAKQNWSKKVREFHETIESINLKINKLNMVVPTLRQQMFHYSAKQEIEQILRCYDDTQRRSPGQDDDFAFRSSASAAWTETDDAGKTMRGNSSQTENRMTLNVVLKELKALFNKS